MQQLLNDYKALADPFFIKETACVRDTIQVRLTLSLRKFNLTRTLGFKRSSFQPKPTSELSIINLPTNLQY